MARSGGLIELFKRSIRDVPTVVSLTYLYLDF